MFPQGLPVFPGAGVGAFTPIPVVVTLTPNGTIDGGSWVAVNAATLHAGLAAGDADFIRATGTATADVALSDPAGGLALTAATVRVRVRQPV